MPRFVWPILVLFTLIPALPADTPRDTPSLRDWAKTLQARLAYGMYMGGKKAGFIVEDTRLTRYDGKEVLAVKSQQYMVTLYDGEKSVKDEKTVFHYELTGDGPMLHAKLVRKEDGKESTYEAVRHGKGMRITSKEGGETLTRDVPIPKDNLATARALEAWLTAPRKAGDRFTKYSLAWDQADIDQKEVYVFKKKKSLTINKVEKTACEVDIDIHGGKLVADVFLDGRPINGVMGNIMTIKLEREAEAKKVEGAPVDLMAASCIVIDLDLSPARSVDELKVRLGEVGDFEVPASHRQVVKKEKDHVLLTLKRDFRVAKGAALTDGDVKQYTATSPRFQCDHKAIVAQARKIVGEEKGALKKARLVERWVYETLKKSYSDGASTALAVLDNKAGACTEHSLLFVALARAAGVPAREVGGLAFIKGDNDKPMMGWHAWAEVHDGHQWVSVDPTWGQVYVDGTHIKLSEGDRDLAWANIAGKVQLKVVEVTKRK